MPEDVVVNLGERCGWVVCSSSNRLQMLYRTDCRKQQVAALRPGFSTSQLDSGGASMIARKFLVCIALSAATLGGCKVDSIEPLSSIVAATPDTALYGVWRYREKGEVTYLHIGPAFSLDPAVAANGAGRPMRIVIVDHKASGLTDEAYTAHATLLGTRRYLNVLQVDDGKPAGYLFVQYARVDGETLRFASVDAKALRAAIANGEIAGRIEGEGPAAQATISADSIALARYFERDGAKLFTKWFVLKRVAGR
jgi:hypothetical protein